MHLIDFLSNPASFTTAMIILIIISVTVFSSYLVVGFWLGWKAIAYATIWTVIVYITVYFSMPLWIDFLENMTYFYYLPDYLLHPIVFGVVFTTFSFLGLIVIVIFRKKFVKKIYKLRSMGIPVRQDRYLGFSSSLVLSLPISIMATIPVAIVVMPTSPINKLYEDFIGGFTYTKWNNVLSEHEMLAKYNKFISYEETKFDTGGKLVTVSSLEAFTRFFTADMQNLNQELMDVYNQTVTQELPDIFLNKTFADDISKNYEKVLKNKGIKINKLDLYDPRVTDPEELPLDHTYEGFQMFLGGVVQQFGMPVKVLLHEEEYNTFINNATEIVINQFVDFSSFEKHYPSYKERMPEFYDYIKIFLSNFVSFGK